MSCDYHNRVDFRAFDVMVHAIDNATREQIKTAYNDAREWSKADYTPTSQRAIWALFAQLLKKQLAKY